MKCSICGSEEKIVSSTIGVCVDCLRDKGEKALKFSRINREKWRRFVGLPENPPRNGVRCNLCVNNCLIPEASTGYCGVIVNYKGRLSTIEGGFEKALLTYYYDPHPTNCVAFPVCPERKNYGKSNLAVFYGGCNLDCFFCQNIEHKYMVSPHHFLNYRNKITTYKEIVDAALDENATCVCYFGGDPTPHTPFSLRVSRELVRRKKIRICWETNGLENPSVMKEIAKLSLISEGIVKIDWKAFTPTVYEALTGVNGEKALKRIKENVDTIIEIGKQRKTPPLLVVSTLIVPGYVDEKEVSGIACYLSHKNPETPYVLLAFYPMHMMKDLRNTSRKEMKKAYEAAISCGLKNVYIGNEWLLT